MVETRDSDAIRQPTAVVGAPIAAADEAIAYAMDFCRSRIGLGDDPSALLKRGNHDAHEYFRRGLAIRIARYLGEIDGTVKAVYVCNWCDRSDEIESEPAGLTSPLSLIAWVDRKTAALGSLLTDLDAALTREYRGLVAPAAKGLRSFLDVNVVEDGEVRERIGYGALVSSVRERPTRVWHREPA
jgi:hypothetical protein